MSQTLLLLLPLVALLAPQTGCIPRIPASNDFLAVYDVYDTDDACNEDGEGREESAGTSFLFCDYWDYLVFDTGYQPRTQFTGHIHLPFIGPPCPIGVKPETLCLNLLPFDAQFANPRLTLDVNFTRPDPYRPFTHEQHFEGEIFLKVNKTATAYGATTATELILDTNRGDSWITKKVNGTCEQKIIFSTLDAFMTTFNPCDHH